MSTAFVAYGLDGVPLAGLSPTWTVVVDATDGSAINPQPAFVELGDGSYKFVFAGTEDLTGIIDMGDSANPRYLHVGADKLVTFAAYNTAGDPLSGLSPTWSFLRNVGDGTAFLPLPSITELSGGLYKFGKIQADVVGVVSLGASALPDRMAYTSASDTYIGAVPPTLGDSNTKPSFLSSEDLELRLPPFVESNTGAYIIGTDTASALLKSVSGETHNVALVFDADVNMWRGTLNSANFEEGEWRVYATSSDTGALPQFAVIWWGDYVDDIAEARQAALGRWKVAGSTLTLYEDDGVSIFQQFSLKDSAGSPTSTEVFDKDPI